MKRTQQVRAWAATESQGEAESVAFVVCAALGVESDDYSFGYVTRWAGGGEEAIAGIKESASRIQQTADRILAAVEVTAVADIAT